MRSLYLTNRFFILFGCIAFGFALSYKFRELFDPMQVVFIGAIAVMLADLLLLYVANWKIEAKRTLPSVTSLGDQNPVQIQLENKSKLNLDAKVIDELPIELQRRDFGESIKLDRGQKKTIAYQFRPVTRGAYQFGKLNVFVSTTIGLWSRRFTPVGPDITPVYPVYHSDERNGASHDASLGTFGWY